MADETRMSPFETIKRTTEDGAEYWSARELADTLQYSGWQRFRGVIERAMTACQTSGYAVSDHFNTAVKLIEAGKGATREIEDWHLSRYACYLVVQNGDYRKLWPACYPAPQPMSTSIP
jgi:DNA-damage-inducible protein D